MNLVWYIFELLMNLVDGIILSQFVIRYFGFKKNIIRKKLLSVLLMFSLFVAITLNNIFFKYYEGFMGIIYVVLTIIFVFAFLKGKVYEKIFVVMFEYGMLVTVSTLIIPIIRRIFKVDITDVLNMESSISRFIMIILAFIIYFFLLEIAIFLKRNNNELKPNQWIFILSISLVSGILMISMFETSINNFETSINNSESLLYFISNIISIIAVLALNFLAYFIVSELTKSNKIEIEYKMLKQSISYEEKNIADIQKLYENMRIIRHDIKQHDEYILSENEKIANINYKVLTENNVIDNILNYKINLAEKAGIKVNYFIEKSKIEIPEIDMSRVLGNLFDNAIEACEKLDLPNKTIEIKIDKRKVYRYILISNPIVQTVKERNPELISTKVNKDFHGFGIRSIRSIVEKYEGIFNFYEENNRIFFEILLAEVNL